MPSADGFDAAAALSGLDEPRPLPPEVRQGVAAALELAGGALPAGLDAPRPVPTAVAARLSHALLARPGAAARLRRMRLGAAAAVVLALLGTLAAATRPVDDRTAADVAVAPTPPPARRTVGTKPTSPTTTAPTTTATTTAGADRKSVV